MLDAIQADYTRSIACLQEEIDVLNYELCTDRASSPQPPTTTAELPPDTHMVPESTSAPAQKPVPPSAPTATPVGAPSWAIVVRKGRKKVSPTAKPALSAKSPSLATAPGHKKGFTMRERCLIIRCDGYPLTPTAMELRDGINRAISSTYVQTVSLT
ncbi:hypothetical protein L873DRAFT_216274 [Choiromyces venosus 120613-1]|uniref:Uncharacterized protein n=1 Tax=Choiromyces venosus 120613-1 TaxID=1336337 RepID=A0A3N4J1M3_9PEZI|nr:hypothetical protein L873DRAFT_216274 [Choiromyces venosus 120613-1]